MMKVNEIYNQDCIEGLRGLPDQSVDCCITSPPYYGLRDYGVDGQIGLEETPEKYVSRLVKVFIEVRRVLRDDGTVWVNLGDTYNAYKANTWNTDFAGHSNSPVHKQGLTVTNLKPKDLIGIPWMVAFALRSDGWYLRQDIIWHKPNPMPESVTDRCTKAHEYIFLLSKSERYYFDQEAIKTESTNASFKTPDGWDTGSGAHGSFHRNGREKGKKGYIHRGDGDKKLTGHSGNFDSDGNLIGNGLANKRSVWTVTTKPFKEAHFATFPPDLIVDCIKAGCRENGIVLDPFMGAGTTAVVARKLNRNFIGFELNEQYIKIANDRIYNEIGLFNNTTPVR